MGGAGQDYNHDAAGRLQQLVQDIGGGATHDLDVSFAYNPAGQITQRTASNIAYAWSEHINADVIAAFNGLNQFTSITGQATPTYDSRGNMTSDGTRTFGFDNRNRLTSVSGGVTINYDPMGRLYNLVTPTENRRFQYDGLNLIAEYNGTGGMEMRYVHGPGVDEPIVQYTGSTTSNREWLIADERGSIIAHTNSTGVANQINTYDEYGLPGSNNDGRFGYTGQVWLEETGLYHYKARAYSPTLGRFLQADPIGQAGGLNVYAYVGGDPVNFTDPLGLMPDPPKCTDEDCIVVVGRRLYKPKLIQRGAPPWGYGGVYYDGAAMLGGAAAAPVAKSVEGSEVQCDAGDRQVSRSSARATSWWGDEGPIPDYVRVGYRGPRQIPGNLDVTISAYAWYNVGAQNEFRTPRPFTSTRVAASNGGRVRFNRMNITPPDGASGLQVFIRSNAQGSDIEKFSITECYTEE